MRADHVLCSQFPRAFHEEELLLWNARILFCKRFEYVQMFPIVMDIISLAYNHTEKQKLAMTNPFRTYPLIQFCAVFLLKKKKDKSYHVCALGPLQCYA